MPFIDKIVNFINDEILVNGLGSAKFAGSDLNGIAFPVPQQDGQAVTWFPGVLNADGSIKAVGVDDRYPLRIYHRVNSAAPQTSNQTQYGDGINRYRDSYNLSMIIYGNRDLIGIDIFSLEALILSKFPSELSKSMKNDLRLLQTTITLGDRQFDPFKVWVEEYRQMTNIGLKANSLLFRINYRIDEIYDKSCFELCNC